MDQKNLYPIRRKSNFNPPSTTACKTNKRLHIQFNHQGCILSLDQDVKTILSLIWKQFGTTQTFYGDSFKYCFLSFNSHNEAASAMMRFNDSTEFNLAITAVKKSLDDETEQFMFHTIFPMIFQERQDMTLNERQLIGSRNKLLLSSWGNDPTPSRNSISQRSYSC